MTAPAVRLTLIGYWDGPDTRGPWPSPTDLVDLTWDKDDRDLIASYLQEGQVARAYMGYARCRFCDQENGDLELTDGTYVWPDGLSHYVADHGVRLPDEFVQHALTRAESLEQAERDVEWWRSAAPSRSTEGLDEHLVDGLAVLEGRDAVVAAVEELRRELRAGPEDEWENDTLERFLDAFGELLGSIESSYVNTDREVPDDPWVLVARALRGARCYE